MEGNTTTDFQEDLLPKKPMQNTVRDYRPTQQDKIETQEFVRNEMQIKYQKYFHQWRDFQMLTMILAMIGLTLAVYEQESDGQDYFQRNLQEIKENSFIRVVITITTFLAVVSLLFRNWLYIFWKDFDNAKELQLKFLQIEADAREEDTLPQFEDPQRKERYNSLVRRRRRYIKAQQESHFKKWIAQLLTTEFLFEVMILVIHPLPYIEEEFTFKIINMLSTKDKLVDVKYMLSDFLFAFMFLRFYFVIRTITSFSQFSELDSKKVCKRFGFESDSSFILKASMTKNTGLTLAFVFIGSIMWLSYLLRIFEKIYYQSQKQKVFDDYITAMWCVIITMTTVGYGDVTAVSPFGRIISIINALWGAFVISMLVSSIGKIFDLLEKQKRAIVDITNAKQAAATLKSSFRYFTAKSEFKKKQAKERANKGVIDPNECQDYVVNKKELEELKQHMIKQADIFRAERKHNGELTAVDEKERDLETIKEQILDINDKFDFLVSLMIKGQKLEPRSYIVNDDEEETDFVLKEGEALTQEGHEPIQYSDVVDFVQKFENTAKKVVGEGRKELRKPAHKLPLSKRVNDAIKYYKQLEEREELLGNSYN